MLHNAVSLSYVERMWDLYSSLIVVPGCMKEDTLLVFTPY